MEGHSQLLSDSLSTWGLSSSVPLTHSCLKRPPSLSFLQVFTQATPPKGLPWPPLHKIEILSLTFILHFLVWSILFLNYHWNERHLFVFLLLIVCLPHYNLIAVRVENFIFLFCLQMYLYSLKWGLVHSRYPLNTCSVNGGVGGWMDYCSGPIHGIIASSSICPSTKTFILNYKLKNCYSPHKLLIALHNLGNNI